MIDLKPRLDDDTDIVEAKKWRNLWFLKDGKALNGSSVVDSEGEARAIGDEAIRELLEGIYLALKFPCGRIVFLHEISHFIPMPIGGDK